MLATIATGSALDVHLGKVDGDTKIVVSLDVLPNAFKLAIREVDLNVQLETDTGDSAVSFLQVLDCFVDLVRFGRHPAGHRGVVKVIVEQLGIGVGGLGKLEGLAHKVIDLSIRRGSDTIAINGFVDDVPRKGLALEVGYGGGHVVLDELLDLRGILLVLNEAGLIVVLPDVSPKKIMATEFHIVQLGKLINRFAG